MDVILPIRRQIIINNERHLLDVNTARQQVSGDQHPTGAGPELTHDYFALLLLHISVLCENQTLSKSR